MSMSYQEMLTMLSWLSLQRLLQVNQMLQEVGEEKVKERDWALLCHHQELSILERFRNVQDEEDVRASITFLFETLDYAFMYKHC